MIEEAVGTVNVFAYCKNNHANMTDPNGYLRNWVKWALVAVAVVVAIASPATFAAAVTMGTAVLSRGAQVVQRIGQRAVQLVSKVSRSKGVKVVNKGAGKAVIKNLDRKKLFEDSAKHIFSDKHIKSGIMDLGKSEEKIMNSAIDIVEKIDGKGMLKEGPTQIKTTINGYEDEIRIFIKDGKPLNFDMFKGHSPRDMGNTIHYNP